jgi:hypothetical protein
MSSVVEKKRVREKEVVTVRPIEINSSECLPFKAQ